METDFPLKSQSQNQVVWKDCLTQKEFPGMIEKLLCMQRHCKDIGEISSTKHLPVIQQCFQHTLDWLSKFLSRDRCERCLEYHIRTVLQGAEIALITAVWKLNELTSKHSPCVGGRQQIQVHCSGWSIEKLQDVKRQLIYVKQLCRKGEQFKQQIYSGLDELSQQYQYESSSVYRAFRDLKQAIAVFKDPDGRPAVSRENCANFKYTTIMRQRLKTLKELYQDMAEAPVGQDKQFFLQQLANVSAQLHKISNEPKCSRCRDYHFEEGRKRFDANVETVRAAVSSQQIDSQTLAHIKSLIRVELCAYELYGRGCFHEPQYDSEQTEESECGMEVKEPQIEWQTPSSVYRPTRTQGTVMLRRWKQLQTGYNQSFQSNTSKSQLKALVDPELKRLKELDEEYETLPKCQTCLSLRGRVQRQLMQTNCQRAKRQRHFSKDKSFGYPFDLLVKLICESMARLVTWCQLQPFLSD